MDGRKMNGMAWLAAALALTAQAARRPNIVVITTDDMGVEVGAYGDPYAKTPHIDKLAEQGVLFRRGYATQSSCSPCRSSILSGLYPHQNGQVGLEQFGYTMKPGTKTFFHWLKEAGYHTGWFGKVHVAIEGENWEDVWDFRPFGAPFTTQVEKMAGWAEGFIKEAAGRPFLLYYNLVDPHAPYKDQIEGVPAHPRGPGDVEPWPWLGIRNAARANALVASYFNCVERADAGIGFLMEVLERTGTAGDTLVVFVSDGGAGFPRAKTHNYNAGTHIPFILRWPGRIPAGMRRDELVSVIDIAPTLLEACGLPVHGGLPGASLLPLLRGGKTAWRDTVFTQHTAHCPHQYFPRRTAFDGRHLLVWNLDGGRRDNPFPEGDVRSRFVIDLIQEKMAGSELAEAVGRAMRPPEYELFDLQDDPAELRNLAGNPEHAPKLEELKRRIQAWQEQTSDPLRLPANLRRMGQWHDELVKEEEPKDEKGRPRYLQIDYVRPRYLALMEELEP